MRTYNRATLIGNVGNDVVLRYTQGGKPVVNLRIATSERRKEGASSTTWHRVVLWDRMAELAQRYVTKGQKLYLEGPLRHREWTDSAGTTRWTTELAAREMIFLSGARGDHERVVEPRPRLGELAEDGEELAEIVQSIDVQHSIQKDQNSLSAGSRE